MIATRAHWQTLAGISGCIAVAMGAVGAHALSDVYLAALVEKASFYQLIHAAVLLFLSSHDGMGVRWMRRLFLTGTLLFCGTLYLKAFGFAGATRLAPAGGISFMAGWIMVAFNRSDK